MSEDIKDDPIPEVEFVRFKHPYEDITGFVIIKGDKLIIDFPLVVELESHYEEGKQALYLKEFLPQGIISKTTIEFPLEDILFHEPVREDFLDLYEEAKEFFFFEQLNAEKKITLKKSYAEPEQYFDEETQEKVENVISIINALRDKKDKPIH